MEATVDHLEGSALTARVRSWRGALLLVVSLCAALAGSLALADAASAARGPVAIVAPPAGALTTSAVVRVEVKAMRPRRSFQASVGSPSKGRRDVTGRFRSVGGGVRSARLRVGDALAEGVNHLYVRVDTGSGHKRTVVRDFTVATHRAELVTVRRPRVGTRSAPVRAIVELRAGRLRARLNGHDVRGAFERRGNSDLWDANLTVHNGLRFGRNRLVVTAFARDGRYDRVRRGFRVRRSGPLADAGRDRRALVGVAERLDGGRSRPAVRGGRLRLRWRIVDRPSGRRPRLRGARGPRPRLIAREPGRYAIRLQARAAGRGNRRDRHGRRTNRPPAFTGSTPSSDTVTVTAQPDVPPSGVPIQTNAFDPANPAPPTGIELGGTFYPAGGAGGIQLMVLDRATLAVVSQGGDPTQTFPPSDRGADALRQAVSKLTSDDLVIVTGGGRDSGLSDGGVKTVAGALASLGSSAPSGDSPAAGSNESALRAGDWSLVGIPGLPAGQAYQLLGRQQGASLRPGAMSGFLRLDSLGNFTFAWEPEFATFDTNAPGSTATKNVISVNGIDYASLNLEPGQSGVQILWLNADSLDERDNWTFLNEPSHHGKCPPPSTPQCLYDFVSNPSIADSLLAFVRSNPDAMLLITTIGQPNIWADQYAWGLLAGNANSVGVSTQDAAGLTPFGANAQVMLALDAGNGDYSFVGTNGLGALGPNRGADVNTALDGTQAPRLVGTFKRNRQGLLVPGGHAIPGPDVDATLFESGLLKVLATPAEPFPAFDSAAEQAAERYIAGQLDLSLDPKFGIRANYWQDQNVDWTAMSNQLATMQRCTAHPCSVGFADVRSQLEDEFDKVATVLDYFSPIHSGALYEVLSTATTAASIDLQGITHRIDEDYDKPSGTAHGSDILGITEGLLEIGSATPEVGGAFAVTDGAFEIASALSHTSDGSSLWDPRAFNAQVANFASALSSTFTAGVANLGLVAELLVGDWGGLQDAADQIDDDAGPHGWGLNAQRNTALVDALTLSLRRYAWHSLLPVPFKVWSINTNNPNDHSDHPSPANELLARVGIYWRHWSIAFLYEQTWYLCRGQAPNSIYPSSQQVELLFNSPNANDNPGLGFTRERFYAPPHSSTTPGFTHENSTAWDHSRYCGHGG